MDACRSQYSWTIWIVLAVSSALTVVANQLVHTYDVQSSQSPCRSMSRDMGLSHNVHTAGLVMNCFCCTIHCTQQDISVIICAPLMSLTHECSLQPTTHQEERWFLTTVLLHCSGLTGQHCHIVLHLQWCLPNPGFRLHEVSFSVAPTHSRDAAVHPWKQWLLSHNISNYVLRRGSGNTFVSGCIVARSAALALHQRVLAFAPLLQGFANLVAHLIALTGACNV